MKTRSCLALACLAGLAVSAAANAQVVVIAGSGAMIPGVEDPANLLPGSQDDDATVGVTIPAAYGNIVLPAGLYFADTNGRLTTDGLSLFTNAALSGASPAGYYPLWDDLYCADYAVSGIYAVDTGTVFVVQWNFDPYSYAVSGYPAAYPSDNARLQLQIFPAGHIPAAQFVYSGMGTIAGQSATIGVVTTGGVAAQYSVNSPTVGDAVQLDVVAGASGACCLADGSCVVSTSGGCAAQGGVYRGNDTQCASANCPQPAGQYTYAGGSIDIPDGTGTAGCGTTVFAEITVPDSFSVTGVTASVNLTHSWQGDAQFRLVHGAVTVPLAVRPGVGYNASTYGFANDNYGASGAAMMRFTDAGATRYQAPDILNGIDNVTGDWKPDSGTMSLFIGGDAQGVWRLEAEDCAGGDTGAIQAFRINLEGGGAAVCYPNCDHSTVVPFLNVLDFNCFLNQFSAGASYANCDGSTIAPVLNVLDFNCFLNRFSAGCSAP